VLKRDRYLVSVTGCRLGTESVRIALRARTLRLRLAGPEGGCGRWRAAEPVVLGGRANVAFSLPRNASIVGVQASPAGRSRAGTAAARLTITDATTPSPAIRGPSSRGITLADAFRPGWQTSGSDSGHFRTALGFNGFLLDEPGRLGGLSYTPQLTREFFLVLSTLGWGAIAAGWIFYARRRRPRRYPSV
jgi:hypothetical protein